MSERIQRNLKNRANESKTRHIKMWGIAKAVLRRKFIAINSYIKNDGRFQVSNITSHFKNLEKEEQKPSK